MHRTQTRRLEGGRADRTHRRTACSLPITTYHILWVANSKSAGCRIANSKSGEIERTCRLAISYQIGDRKLEDGRGEIEHTSSLALASSYQIADRTYAVCLFAIWCRNAQTHSMQPIYYLSHSFCGSQTRRPKAAGQIANSKSGEIERTYAGV
jgi:hypothetical protein